MHTTITILYWISLRIYSFFIFVASIGNRKARLLFKGRRAIWTKLKSYDNTDKCIWVHAASLGEFEQGRPLIEAIREKYPERRIVLSFFSPSGYEIRKNYDLADLVVYLPSDSPRKARRFIEAINPEMAFFVKYEYWYFFLNELQKRSIPVYGISQIFRKEQVFFQPYGDWFISMLRKFTHLYIQDQISAQLLDKIDVNNYTVAGDTRFDRVKKIAEASRDIPLCEKFVKGAECVIVAGSTWPRDEDFLIPYVEKNNIKLIIAPHEVHTERIKGLYERIKVKKFCFSDPPQDIDTQQVMIINTIGLLSSVYKYGNISYIGGGFGKGIHNTLEAATYGLPVVFGPNHKQFKEAVDLISCGGGFTFSNQKELNDVLDNLRTSIQTMAAAQEASASYVAGLCGATERIMTDVFGGVK